MDDASRNARRRSSPSRLWLVLGLVGALGLVLLWDQHKEHLLGAIPWLVLLACPLVHVFMHGHHGGHGNHEDT